jgi:hypothetical protein
MPGLPGVTDGPEGVRYGAPVVSVQDSDAEPRPAEVSGDGPRTPTTSPWTARGVAAAVGFVVVATLIQLPRSSGVPMWRTLWAEDGSEFLGQAIARPLSQTLFRPYAGYGQFVPRIIAAVVVHLPASWWPAAMALSASLAVSLLALFVYIACRPLLVSPVRRGVLAASMVLLASLPAETIGSIANIHWFLSFAALFAVLFPVERPVAVVVRAVIVVCCALSSPIGLFVVPIALYRLVQDKRWITRVVPALLVLACALQLVIWARAEHPPNPHPATSELARGTVKLFGDRVVTELVLGVWVPLQSWSRFGYWLTALALAIVAALIVAKWMRSTAASRTWMLTLAAASAFTYVVSVYLRTDQNLAAVVPHLGTYTLSAERYQVFPQLLLLSALLVPPNLLRGPFARQVPLSQVAGRATPLVDPAAPTHVGPAWAGWAVLAVWVLVAIIPSYRQQTGRYDGPDFIDQTEAMHEACAADPLGHQVLGISPPGWTLGVPCTTLKR